MVCISKAYLDKFEKKIASLNKKLVAKNITPISYAVKKCIVPFCENSNIQEFCTEYDVEIDKDFVIPECDDWKLVAIVDHDNHVITSMIENVNVEQYRNNSHCDHCHTNRYRKKTLIIQNKDGKLMSVGTSCVNDFFGYDLSLWLNKLNVLSWLEQNADNDELGSKCWGGLPLHDRMYSVQNLLSLASSLIREYGFEPSSSATSTRAQMTAVVNGDTKVNITKDDENTARKVLDWAKNIDDSETNYLLNIRELAKNEFCTYKVFGYIASMIPTYQKKNVNASNEKSEFIGNIGEKIAFKNMTHENSYSFDGYYGMTYIHVFSDISGNKVVWKTQKNIPNTNSSFTAKIKDHVLYNGIKQTEISYVKF